MYAVCVEFGIHPDRIDEFMPLMERQAENSLTLEEGCHRFDVWRDGARENAVYLYEIYTDRAAFEIHLASAHFKEFDAAVAPMLTSKTVTTWDRAVRVDNPA
jgi:quinol monooxygenase YgiN